MRALTTSLIFVLVSSLGLQAAIWNEDPKNFKKGETYQYQYSSQVLSGLPKSSWEYHGVQINSVVEFTVDSNAKIIMTLKDPQLLESVNNIRTRTPYNFVDGKNFKKFRLAPPKSLEMLALPVQYSWDLKNKVTNFKTLSTDHPLSINIKRGIINMFNMKLKLSDDDWKEDGGSYHNREDEGIEGICEANYVWLPYPFETQASKRDDVLSLTLTRIKTANRCLKPAGYDFANYVSWKTGEDKKDQNRTLVKNFNEASMNITLHKSKAFFVWEAASKAGYTIASSDISKEIMTTTVLQSLKFLKTTTPSKVEMSGEMVEKSLVMDIVKRNVTLSKDDIKRISSLVKRLGSQIDNVNPELITLLRQADEKNFMEISKNVRTILDKRQDLIKPYLHALSEVLTFESTKSLVQEFILKPYDSGISDNFMSLRVGPLAGMSSVEDTKIIDLLTNAASKTMFLKDKNRSNTLKSIWLTIGSLSGLYYSQNPKYDIESSIKYFTKVVKSLKSSLSEETTNIIVLKALGNIGVAEIVPYLKEVINDKKQPISMRVQAIYSLRKVPRKDTSIERMLIRVYHNVNEDVEIRIAAALDILLRYKCKLTLGSIAVRLSREPIKQVRAYIQDLIYVLAQIPTMKRTFEPILQKISIKSFSSEYSRAIYVPTKKGAFFLNIIYSPDSLIPRTGNILHVEFLFGKGIYAFEMGFRFENAKSGDITSYKSFQEYIMNTVKMPKSERNENSPRMTLFLKKFNNEVGFWSMDSELVKMFNIEKFEDFVGFLKGNKVLGKNIFLNRMINGEILLPTTMGLQYSAQIHSTANLNFDFEISKVIDLKQKSSNLKIDIKPRMMAECIFDFGIDTGLLKSQVNSRFYFSSSRSVQFTILKDDATKAMSIGFTKPKRDIVLLKHLFEKKFKVTYYNSLSDPIGISKFYNITPFYVPEKEARKMKSKNMAFPFNANLTWYYFCDVAKPRTDGILKSIFSAGDAYSKFKIKASNDSDFDEFSLGLREEVFHGTRKFVISANHLKNKELQLKVDLMTFKLIFGYGARVEMEWPETMEDLRKAIRAYSKDTKVDTKFVKLSGSISFAKPIVFDEKNPLALLRDQKEYTPSVTASVRSSQGKLLYNFKVELGMDKEAKELGKQIRKNPEKYAEHCKMISQCSEDMGNKIPHSPSCFKSWLKLNNYNKFKLSLNWTKEGYERLKKVYNKMNKRVYMSEFLVSSKFENNPTDYELSYVVPPYFHRSSVASISFLSLTKVYKRAFYSRNHISQRMFKRMSITPIIIPEIKTCQIRLGKTKAISVKTFDYYFFTIKKLITSDPITDARSILLLQDEDNMIQIMVLRTSTDILVQALGKNLPLLRIIRTGSKIEFEVNKVRSGPKSIIINNVTIATLSVISQTVYGNKSLHELNINTLNIRIVTDLATMLDVEVPIRFKSTLRGICGDMNGEVFNEFKNFDCTAAYASIDESLSKSIYRRNFKDITTDSKIVEFIPIKKCPQSTKLSLI